MKILVIGAGAIGGYFGGRLIEAGKDVTFLVRNGRKKQLDENGIVINSFHGDYSAMPKTIIAGDTAEPFDIILLSTKAYHLQSAINDFKQYVSEHTVIIPLLNGIAHLEQLDEAFGEEKVLGGLCFIETTLDEDGTIVQTSPAHHLLFGNRFHHDSYKIAQIAETLSGTKANIQLNDQIDQEMWKKYLFIAVFSGITSLFRSPIGPIREHPSGLALIHQAAKEAEKVMQKLHVPIEAETQLQKMQEIGDNMKSSLQRDMEKHLQIEGDHFFGYLLKKANELNIECPVLTTIYTNLKIYEANLVKNKS